MEEIRYKTAIEIKEIHINKNLSWNKLTPVLSIFLAKNVHCPWNVHRSWHIFSQLSCQLIVKCLKLTLILMCFETKQGQIVHKTATRMKI